MNLNDILADHDLEHDKEDVFDAIVGYFKKNETPKDDEIHDLAEKMGVDPHRFEEQIYELLSVLVRLVGTRYSPDQIASVDPKELEAGTRVEMEHLSGNVKNPGPAENWVAQRIALDHLVGENIPDYYTRLKKMEKEAKKGL